ncbi:MAG: hypothetical protein MMC33_010157 [Icmadophila ericetorum]|nr:hypothetical protein [Icmadophila ericetorum]
MADMADRAQIAGFGHRLNEISDRMEEQRHERDRLQAIEDEAEHNANVERGNLTRAHSEGRTLYYDDVTPYLHSLDERLRANNDKLDCLDRVLDLELSRIQAVWQIHLLGGRVPLGILQCEQSVALGLQHVDGEQPDATLSTARVLLWRLVLWRSQVTVYNKKINVINARLEALERNESDRPWDLERQDDLIRHRQEFAAQRSNLERIMAEKNAGFAQTQADLEQLLANTPIAESAPQEGNQTSTQEPTPAPEGDHRQVVTSAAGGILQTLRPRPQVYALRQTIKPKTRSVKIIRQVLYIDGLIEDMADRINLREARPCEGTRHVLKCLHLVRTDSEICATDCANPKDSLLGVRGPSLLRAPPYCHRCVLHLKDTCILRAIGLFGAYQIRAIAAQESQFVVSQVVRQLDDEKTLWFGRLRRLVKHPSWDKYASEGVPGIRHVLYTHQKTDIREFLRESMWEANVSYRINQMLDLALANAKNYSTEENVITEARLPHVLQEFKESVSGDGWIVMETIIEFLLGFYSEKLGYTVTLDNITLPQLLVLECICQHIEMAGKRDLIYDVWDGCLDQEDLDAPIDVDDNGRPVPGQRPQAEQMARRWLKEYEGLRRQLTTWEREVRFRQAVEMPLPVQLYPDDQPEECESDAELPDPIKAHFTTILTKMDRLHRGENLPGLFPFGSIMLDRLL